MSLPSHRAIRAVIAPLDDAELDLWTRAEDSYTLREDRGPGIPGCTIWVLSPVGVSTPVGIRLVSSSDGLVLTSGQLPAIAALLRRHPRRPQNRRRPERPSPPST